MDMPRFVLALEDVIEIHQDQISRYGGSEGIRDQGLLESAVASPLAGFGGELLAEDLPAMAGAYLYHLAKNHPFIDGNKRVAAAAALVFLYGNGLELNCTDEELVGATLAVATSKFDKPQIAQFIRNHITPLEPSA